jgi:hypothetical protein
MDRTISWLPPANVRDPLDGALSKIDAAIALVVAGVAVTITPCFFESAEEAAFAGAMWAQAAGVAFRLRRDPPDSVSIVIGPRVSGSLAPIDPESES